MFFSGKSFAYGSNSNSNRMSGYSEKKADSEMTFSLHSSSQRKISNDLYDNGNKERLLKTQNDNCGSGFNQSKKNRMKNISIGCQTNGY